MAYLTVDKDGTEWVWNCCPLRNKYRGRWESYYSDDQEYQSVELPKGSIEKLIGWTMTWEHEPYELIYDLFSLGHNNCRYYTFCASNIFDNRFDY